MDVFEINNAGPVLSVCLVSDTHGAVDERIARVVAESDYAVHAGDIGHARVVQALVPRKHPLMWVRGNNDTPAKWPACEAAVLATIPDVLTLTLPGGPLVVVHGHRHGAVRERHARLRAAFPQARAIVYGHSHRLVYDDTALPWVLNPGAAGHVRTFGGPSCLILTIKGGQWSVTERRFTGKAA